MSTSRVLANVEDQKCHDQLSMWVDQEISSLHKALRAKHWANPIGRDILKHLLAACSEEIWAADPAPVFEPPLDVSDAKWIAALMIAEAAKEARANLKPYAENYVKTAPWYFKPWVILESAVCSRAILPLLNDLIQLPGELRIAHEKAEAMGSQSAA